MKLDLKKLREEDAQYPPWMEYLPIRRVSFRALIDRIEELEKQDGHACDNMICLKCGGGA